MILITIAPLQPVWMEEDVWTTSVNVKLDTQDQYVRLVSLSH